jgi:hypothetical protein
MQCESSVKNSRESKLLVISTVGGELRQSALTAPALDSQIQYKDASHKGSWH